MSHQGKIDIELGVKNSLRKGNKEKDVGVLQSMHVHTTNI